MKKILFTLIVLMVFPLCSFAVKVNSLYQAEIPLAAQTDDLREQAVKQGLLQVLIKVSGNPTIDQNPEVKESLRRADYFVQEYSYAPSSPSSSQYLLQIRYDAADINRLLNRAGIAFWGEHRPLILVWLTYATTPQDAVIVSNESDGDLLTTLKNEGKRYGLPVIFPEMDITDVSQVTPNDITNLTLPVLQNASKRYAPDALLIGNIQKNDQDYDSQWELILNNDKWSWKFSDISTANIINAVVNQISQTFAEHFVAKKVDMPDMWLKLEVNNVAARDDLTSLMQYLQQLALVQQVQLAQVAGETVELNVLIHGTLDTFQQNAVIGQHLVLKSQDPKQNILVFDWVR